MSPTKTTKTAKKSSAKPALSRKASGSKKPRGAAGKTARKPVKKKAPLPPAPPPAENPRAQKLASHIAKLCLEKKASDVVVLDVRGMTSYADYVVVASGDSERQVSAMAEHVELKLKEQQERVLGTEGRETGNWVLLDYGEVVAHLFQADQRAFYDLEGLWADARKETVS